MAALVSARLSKTNELAFKAREQKLSRYKEVVLTVRQFIDKPKEATFIAVLLAMRRDLRMAKKKIEGHEVSL